jgi:hypothetical protein
MAFETVHTDDTPGKSFSPPNQKRLRDHERDYVKPRPAGWWNWHCIVCNAPVADKP